MEMTFHLDAYCMSSKDEMCGEDKMEKNMKLTEIRNGI